MSFLWFYLSNSQTVGDRAVKPMTISKNLTRWIFWLIPLQCESHPKMPLGHFRIFLHSLQTIIGRIMNPMTLLCRFFLYLKGIFSSICHMNADFPPDLLIFFFLFLKLSGAVLYIIFENFKNRKKNISRSGGKSAFI